MRKRLTLWLGMSVFAALMGASCGAAVFPATMRLASPLVCPSGTARSVVVRRVSSSNGKTSVSGELRCVLASGEVRSAPTPLVLGGLLLIYSAVGLVLLAAQVLVGRLRRAAPVALLLLGGCSIGTLTPDEYAAEFGGFLYHGPAAETAATAIRRRAGGAEDARVRRVSIYGDYLTVEALDPRHPGNVDLYTYRDGRVAASPDAVSVRDDLQAEAFNLGEVPFARLDGIVAAAQRELGVTARPSSIVASRERSGPVVLVVALDDRRRGGSVRFAPDGTLLGAHRR